MISKKDRYHFRKARTRQNLLDAGLSRPRLSVYRSDKYLYAQVVDDAKGTTLVAASGLEKELKGKAKSGKSVEAAKLIGALVAKRAIEKGIKEVCFDKGGRIYHGRIKALADAARAAGLKF